MAQFFGYSRLTRAADWEGLAGAWVPVRSAYELAQRWQTSKGLPLSILGAINSSGHEPLADLTLDFCLVEKPVFLDTHIGPSMTDIMAVGRNREEKLVVVGVEGKADEPFGLRTSSWIRGDAESPPPNAIPRPTRLRRLAFLCEHLGVDIGSESRLRYQLIHRTVSVLIDAGFYGAEAALVLVHAFGTLCESNWNDYCDFTIALGLPRPVTGQVAGPIALGKSREVSTFFLWWQDTICTARRELERN